MEKYTRPEMECKVFAAENVLTASGQGQNKSSMNMLKQDLTNNHNIPAEQIIEAVWTE